MVGFDDELTKYCQKTIWAFREDGVRFYSSIGKGPKKGGWKRGK
jgi:hypothetical protein